MNFFARKLEPNRSGLFIVNFIVGHEYELEKERKKNWLFHLFFHSKLFRIIKKHINTKRTISSS